MKIKSAARYAQALVDLCEESKPVRQDLKTFSDCLKSAPDFKMVLFKDTFTMEEKKPLLKEVMRRLKLSNSVQTFLFYLVEKRRIVHFFDIQEEIIEKLNVRENKMEVHVTSAAVLTSVLKKKIQEKFERRFHKKMDFIYYANPSLIGGMVTQIGNLIFDDSTRTQLKALEDHLRRGV